MKPNREQLQQLYHHPRVKMARRRLAPYSFGIFIAAVTVLAVVITGVNMALYVSSGASSIDISRPSYQEVRDSITKEQEKMVDFDESSKISTSTIDVFTKLETDAARSRANVSAHNDKSLDDDSLGIPPNGNAQ